MRLRRLQNGLFRSLVSRSWRSPETAAYGWAVADQQATADRRQRLALPHLAGSALPFSSGLVSCFSRPGAIHGTGFSLPSRRWSSSSTRTSVCRGLSQDIRAVADQQPTAGRRRRLALPHPAGSVLPFSSSGLVSCFSCPGAVHGTGFSLPSRRWSSSSTRTCVCQGLSQDISFPISKFLPIDDFQAQYPLVKRVPQGSLYTIDPSTPYLMSDIWRPILFSAFLHSHISKEKKDCIINAYDFDNVGILELKDRLMLSFRKFDRVDGITNDNHMDYSGFVRGLFKRFYGGSDFDLEFPECAGFLADCEQGKDEEVLRYNPFFIQDEELAILYSDMQRLLRQELKHRDKANEAKSVLKGLDKVYDNYRVVGSSRKHILLPHLLGNHGKGGQFAGTALVDICRIAGHHAIEDNVLRPAFTLHPDKRKLLDSYTRVDLIGSVRYMFQKYPGEAVKLFQKENLLKELKMERRLPTPSILDYVTTDGAIMFSA